MAKNWIKLDWDWREDPKVMDFESRCGKAALVDVVGLFCLMGEFEGMVDLTDNGTRLRAERVIGKRGRALERLVDEAAASGIVDADAWRVHRVVTSERAARDWTARKSRKDAVAKATAAAAEKRAAQAAAEAEARRRIFGDADAETEAASQP